MFVRLLLALILLVGVMWFMSWYGKAPPNRRNSAIKTGLLYFVAIALLLLVVTGRVNILFAGIAAAIPVFHRLMAYRGIIGTIGRFAGQKFGPTTLTTAWLVVEYDLAKRSLDAKVTQGQFEGKKLSELNDSELNTLLDLVKEDFQSRAAVNAYMMARQGNTYSQQNRQAPNTDSQITLSQAYEILGLEQNATPDQIKKSHKRLIQKLHPDRGGSSYLAAQINAAKDLLLNHHVS